MMQRWPVNGHEKVYRAGIVGKSAEKYLNKGKNRRMKRKYKERRRGHPGRHIWRKKCGTAV